jgi:hypothetical protein
MSLFTLLLPLCTCPCLADIHGLNVMCKRQPNFGQRTLVAPQAVVAAADPGRPRKQKGSVPPNIAWTVCVGAAYTALMFYSMH